MCLAAIALLIALAAAPAFARGASSHGAPRFGHGYGEPPSDAKIGHETGGEKARYEKTERDAEKAYDKVDSKGLTRAIQAPIRDESAPATGARKGVLGGAPKGAAAGAPKGSAK